ncbi:MAG: MATE family efflux transporter [Angelakisella sp.]|nr:MATE family efflux transporter [Angelakisella sp.]
MPPRALTPEEKFIQMTQTPVAPLIFRLAVPTIISMLVTSVYNMADTFFVGKLGTSATGAVGVVFPLMAIIQAIGFTFGMGSGNYVSRLLGSRDQEKAIHVASVGFVSAVLCGALVTFFGFAFFDDTLRLLGATETILPYARSYAAYILPAAPFMAGAFVLNNILRYQGSAFYSMVGIGIGGVVNIILDPIFIFVFDMGVSGAALATMLSQMLSFGILFYQNYGRNGNIKVSLRHFKPSTEIYKEIFKIGLPSFYRQGLASVAGIFLNLGAGAYGDAAIAAMSIVNRVVMFAFSVLLGFGQGFQPVCGFNYGAKRYDRVRQSYWFCVKVGALVLVGFSVVGFVFAPYIIELFRRGDPEVIAIGSAALRFQCMTLPLSALVVLDNMLMQNLGETLGASLLAVARQGLFFIPMVLVLPLFLGLTGVECAQSCADILTFLLALPLGFATLRKIALLEAQQGGTETLQNAKEMS